VKEEDEENSWDSAIDWREKGVSVCGQCSHDTRSTLRMPRAVYFFVRFRYHHDHARCRLSSFYSPQYEPSYQLLIDSRISMVFLFVSISFRLQPRGTRNRMTLRAVIWITVHHDGPPLTWQHRWALCEPFLGLLQYVAVFLCLDWRVPRSHRRRPRYIQFGLTLSFFAPFCASVAK
jgi:hypothetical protein